MATKLAVPENGNQRVHVNIRHSIICLFAITVLISCADLPKEFSFDSNTIDPENKGKTWPNTVEERRFSYHGELIGESNFSVESGARQNTGVRFLKWIAGLSNDPDKHPLTLLRPQGGVVDSDGRIFVSDIGRHAILVFDRPAGELKVWEWASSAIRFKSPVGLAIRENGELLVADADLGIIVVLSKEGKPVNSVGADQLERPTGLALDRKNGLLYVADTRANDIKVFNHNGDMVQRFGAGQELNTRLNAPTYIAVSDDKIYVSDTLNARVQIYNKSGKAIGTIGERGLYIGNLVRPKGITVSDDGLVYIVESYYDHLLVYDKSGQFLMPIGGTGSKPGQFFLPTGVWTDVDGRVYISDMMNGRVSVFKYLGADS